MTYLERRAFDNSYARLPDRFFARLRPIPVATPRLVRLNEKLAGHLGLDPGKLATPEGVEILAGNHMPARGEPLAMAYAGHQFGTFVPQLGDGRAILLGEVIDRDGVRRDIQLKGSGRTPFSRHGDGRAPLGPVLREYIVSEAMAALGIPSILKAILSGGIGVACLSRSVLHSARQGDGAHCIAYERLIALSPILHPNIEFADPGRRPAQYRGKPDVVLPVWRSQALNCNRRDTVAEFNRPSQFPMMRLRFTGSGQSGTKRTSLSACASEISGLSKRGSTPTARGRVKLACLSLNR